MKRMRELNSADRRERTILILFVLAAVILVAVWAFLVGTRYGFRKDQGRTNPQQSGTKRVIDQADMLTDEQERALEEKIAQTQEKIRADIVIVILNESLEARYPDLIYSRVDETGAYEGIRRYAESYWVENGFGGNEPGNTGNGIIMVDNVYRESNGWVYNWVAGAGDMRFSVGDSTCEKLSQAFTDRLRYGDLPPYTQLYADALMEFVSDCGSFGYSVRGMLGWQLFTPRVMFAVITSSLVVTIAAGAVILFLLGLMVWHLQYNGRQRKRAAHRKNRRSSIFTGTAGAAVLFLLANVFIAMSEKNAVISVIIVFAVVIGMLLYHFLLSPKKDGEKEKKVRKGAPFARRDPLDMNYRVTGKSDHLVRHYTTSYTESESSGGGGLSGGGGFSGGGGGFSGGGGGGFSGGGSHR